MLDSGILPDLLVQAADRRRACSHIEPRRLTPDHEPCCHAACGFTGVTSCITAHRKPTSSRATATTAICGRLR